MNRSEQILNKIKAIVVSEGQDVGKTILQQLGGNKFIAMTGSKNIAFDSKDNSLSFKVGKNARGITHVSVKLTPDDLYNMTFFKIRGTKVKEEVVKGVIFDQLQEIFTDKTGLNTRL